MKRKNYRPYVLLALFLFGCINLPSAVVTPFQAGVVRLSSPLWKKLSLMRLSFVSSYPVQGQRKTSEEKILKLEAENAELTRQNERLKKRILSNDRIESQFKKLNENGSKEFFLRRQKHIETRLNLEAHSLFAQVVYRQPSAWNSSIWVDVGEHDNEAIGFPVVSVNSPVLSGEYLIGIVESVGKKQSRVRLLTDSSLVVSVRAIRGAEQHREMLHLIDHLSLGISLNGESLLSAQEEKTLFEKLGVLKEKLQTEAGDKYLAKGELFGTSSPLWRSRSPVLRGIGFNYDFEDVEGPARELRTGKPYSHLLQDKGIVLIQEGDLLVTTGMDGLFPPDLPVALVTKVDPLKEGSASFSIEAQLCTPTIDDLSSVMVLPSLDFLLEEKL